MEFQSLITRAVAVRNKYAEFEKEQYGREWTREELMLGFMKDVGDLAKLVQAKEGVRQVDDMDSALGHELADCMWSIIILADKCDVDLEAVFIKTMNELGSQLEE